MTDYFNELDYRLSVIKRWNLVPTIQQQSVATHIFNVERIAERLARDCGCSEEQIGLVRHWAHHHEDFEALHGDFPSMAKPYFQTEEFEEEHRDLMPRVKPANDEVKHIVKLADQMEMYYFLSMEVSLGNRFLKTHLEQEYDRVLQYCATHLSQLQIPVAQWLSRNMTVMSVRHSKRGR